MFKALTIVVCCLFLLACSNKGNRPLELQSEKIVIRDLCTIPVQIENDSYDHLEDILHTVSYVQLAPEPLLSGIKDIHIYNEKIYIWDATSRLFCYDMQGNVIYQIDAQGGGPGEYIGLNAFAINTDKKELVIYDNLKLSLLYYSLDNGEYLRTEKLNKPNPTEMVYADGTYFYNNRNHRNYPNDSILHHSLLASTNGLDIEQYYFHHDDDEEQYVFSPSSQTFYDNSSHYYYCRNFDNIVYQLGKDSLKACYKIELPNPLPLSEIKSRRNEMELIKSGYSFGITSVYECDSILYFRFIKDRYIMATLYDLAKNKQICCAKSIGDMPTSQTPIFDVINGVYKGCFYSVLTPDFIDYTITEKPGKYPEVFHEYDAQLGNPVIAFYQVNRKK